MAASVMRECVPHVQAGLHCTAQFLAQDHGFFAFLLELCGTCLYKTLQALTPAELLLLKYLGTCT